MPKDIYRARKIGAETLFFSDPILNDMLFGFSESTLVAAGLSRLVQKNWIDHMIRGIIPTLNRYGQEADFVSWEAFERHVRGFFNDKKQTLRMKRALLRVNQNS